MAKAKRLHWEDMNQEQREKALAASKKWGIPVEKVKMTVTGLVVLDKEDSRLQTEREMVAKGWADCVEEITDIMLQKYVDECNEQAVRHIPVRLR